MGGICVGVSHGWNMCRCKAWVVQLKLLSMGCVCVGVRHG